MPAMHLRYFTVRGRGEFPLDMLRYDNCWPRSGEDVALIAPSYETGATREQMATRDVQLCRYTQLKSGLVSTAGRWDSFSWTVVSEE